MDNLFTYKTTKKLDKHRILHLYEDAGWVAYTNDINTLLTGIENSQDVITCWAGDLMVGLIRTLGDTKTILYIQDILVLESFQRQGIGSELMRQVIGKYPDVRQKILLAEDSFETRRFFQSLDFVSYDKGILVAFGLKEN